MRHFLGQILRLITVLLLVGIAAIITVLGIIAENIFIIIFSIILDVIILINSPKILGKSICDRRIDKK